MECSTETYIREVNRCADKLARFGHRLSLGLTFFNSLPICISRNFLVDSSGRCSPRLVHVKNFWGLGPDINGKKKSDNFFNCIKSDDLKLHKLRFFFLSLSTEFLNSF